MTAGCYGVASFVMSQVMRAFPVGNVYAIGFGIAPIVVGVLVIHLLSGTVAR